MSFWDRVFRLGVVGFLESRGVLEEDDEGVVAFLEVEDIFEGEAVEVVSGILVLGAHKQDVEAGLDGVISAWTGPFAVLSVGPLTRGETPSAVG